MNPDVITLDPADAALTWWLRHGQQHRRIDAVTRCIEHLMTHYAMTQDAAEVLAIQTCAELSEHNVQSRIDIDESTANVLILRDACGHRTVVTVSELLALVGREREAGRVMRLASSVQPAATARRH